MGSGVSPIGGGAVFTIISIFETGKLSGKGKSWRKQGVKSTMV